MNILITSGGTSEPIDTVRSITNHATGRLGSIIGDEFMENTDNKVYYVCGKTAIRPKNKAITIIPVTSTKKVEEAIVKLTNEIKLDVIIHAMAISDYRAKYVFPLDSLVEELNKSNSKLTKEEVFNIIEKVTIGGKEGKISSSIDSPLILLEKTPKVISMLRDLAPNAIIIGFKLLSNVTNDELFNVAENLLIKNKCDYVLANDITSINGDTHKGYLIGKDKSIITYFTKQEIAKGIVNAVLKGGK